MIDKLFKKTPVIDTVESFGSIQLTTIASRLQLLRKVLIDPLNKYRDMVSHRDSSIAIRIASRFLVLCHH